VLSISLPYLRGPKLWFPVFVGYPTKNRFSQKRMLSRHRNTPCAFLRVLRVLRGSGLSLRNSAASAVSALKAVPRFQNHEAAFCLPSSRRNPNIRVKRTRAAEVRKGIVRPK